MLLFGGVDVDGGVHGVLIAADERSGGGGQRNEATWRRCGRMWSGLVQMAF